MLLVCECFFDLKKYVSATQLNLANMFHTYRRLNPRGIALSCLVSIRQYEVHDVFLTARTSMIGRSSSGVGLIIRLPTVTCVYIYTIYNVLTVFGFLVGYHSHECSGPSHAPSSP